MSECEDFNDVGEQQYFILVMREEDGAWDLVAGGPDRSALAVTEATLIKLHPDYEYQILRTPDDKVAIKMALRLMNWNRDLI